MINDRCFSQQNERKGNNMSNQSWDREFDVRFARHEDELKWLYMELYHNDRRAWEYFTGMIRRAWESRPETLRRMDRERESNPGWIYRRLLRSRRTLSHTEIL